MPDLWFCHVVFLQLFDRLYMPNGLKFPFFLHILCSLAGLFLYHHEIFSRLPPPFLQVTRKSESKINMKAIVRNGG